MKASRHNNSVALEGGGGKVPPTPLRNKLIPSGVSASLVEKSLFPPQMILTKVADDAIDKDFDFCVYKMGDKPSI